MAKIHQIRFWLELHLGSCGGAHNAHADLLAGFKGAWSPKLTYTFYPFS